VSDAVGEVELEGRVLVIRGIHVTLRLRAEEPHRETAFKVHGLFAEKCPVYLSLYKAITITTELLFEPLAPN
jgi:uncharacterized OsmC-like protein